MSTEKFKKCPKCGEFVPEKITICPCCNSSLKEKTPTSRFIGGFICGIVGFIGIMLIISGITDLKSTDADNSFTNDTKSNVITSIPTTAHDTTPIGNKMALESAKNYLRTMGFSKERLIAQLEYEGYSTEEATYAVNNCGANWKEQAVRVAKNYLNTMPLSKQGLLDQLEYEGFTNEEARYGVEQAYK